MSLFDPKGSYKAFFFWYLAGFFSFAFLVMGLPHFLSDASSVGIDADGTYDLGFPQSYFETMYALGPATLAVMMVLSCMLISWMTSAKKGGEALIIGILSGLFIGLFVTMSMQEALSGNLSDLTGSFEHVDVEDRAMTASHVFVGTLFIWLNFFFELFRFKPEEELDL